MRTSDSEPENTLPAFVLASPLQPTRSIVAGSVAAGSVIVSRLDATCAPSRNAVSVKGDARVADGEGKEGRQHSNAIFVG